VDKFEVILSPHAVKDLDGFSDSVCKKIAYALKTLTESPFPRGKLIRKLKGKNADFY
jgi:mRNA-degrading endonuclease RelE of RelBE toxin-antitoxin system